MGPWRAPSRRVMRCKKLTATGKGSASPNLAREAGEVESRRRCDPVRASAERVSAGASALRRRGAHHEAQDREQHLGPGLGCRGGGVVLGHDLDHVAADEVEAGKAAQELE